MTLDLFPLFTCYKVKRRLSRDPFPGYTVNMDCYRPMWHIKPCPCFPGFNFQSTWSHEYHSPWWNMVYGSLTVHWANSESRPAEDPVDSDHFPGSPPGATDGLIQEDFAVPVWTLTVFFRLACSEVHIHLQTLPFRKCVKLHAQIPKCYAKSPPRCDLSVTYHGVPLTLSRLHPRVQYDNTAD